MIQSCFWVVEANIIVVSLGIQPKRVHYRETPPVGSENLTNNSQCLRNDAS